jgi:hypothetical protein
LAMAPSRPTWSCCRLWSPMRPRDCLTVSPDAGSSQEGSFQFCLLVLCFVLRGDQAPFPWQHQDPIPLCQSVRARRRGAHHPPCLLRMFGGKEAEAEAEGEGHWYGVLQFSSLWICWGGWAVLDTSPAAAAARALPFTRSRSLSLVAPKRACA